MKQEATTSRTFLFLDTFSCYEVLSRSSSHEEYKKTIFGEYEYEDALLTNALKKLFNRLWSIENVQKNVRLLEYFTCWNKENYEEKSLDNLKTIENVTNSLKECANLKEFVISSYNEYYKNGLIDDFLGWMDNSFGKHISKELLDMINDGTIKYTIENKDEYVIELLKIYEYMLNQEQRDVKEELSELVNKPLEPAT